MNIAMGCWLVSCRAYRFQSRVFVPFHFTMLFLMYFIFSSKNSKEKLNLNKNLVRKKGE